MTATILVVEADSAIRGFLLECLSDEGYQVLATATGAAAMQILVTHRIDLVLLDRGLPDMDGVSVWSRVRASTLTRHLPVILTSAGRLEAGHAYGPDTMVLSKPFPLDDLLGVVARLVDGGMRAAPQRVETGLMALQRRRCLALAEVIRGAGMAAAMQVLSAHGWPSFGTS